MYKLSILIPARNEEFLSRTIDDILMNKGPETEIIVGLDGEWADPPVIDHPDVRVLYYPESIGQRAMTNRLCSLSKAKWIIKADAHCKFDKDFDSKLLAAVDGHDDWTAVPIMKNLHIFNWVCKKCGDTRYQGPTPTDCPKCNNSGDFVRDMIWKEKPSPNSTSYLFDSTPHFQYFKEYEKRPEFKKDYKESRITESMSLQGSFFMLTRERYWALNICDEKFGSWGSQGIEVACKTWLSGGRVVCVHTTWYAHLFRTQGGDFGFPYPLPGKQVQNAREMAKSIFLNGGFDKQIKPLSWLLNRFWPVRGWDFIPEDPVVGGDKLSKGIIYYTDNQLNLKISRSVQSQLKSIGLPIVSASLKPMSLGKNIVLPLKRSKLSMFKQIEAALEASTADIIYFCEHDVIYHPSHFEFNPTEKNTFYFNTNVWKVDNASRKALRVDKCEQLSGMCIYRDLALSFCKEKIAQMESVGFDGHYEPQGHRETWESALPNVDIRHDNNLTANRWSKEEFRNQENTIGWTEGECPEWAKDKF